MHSRRWHLKTALILMGFCASLASIASEYSHEDSLPRIESISFLADAVVIQTNKRSANFFPYQDPSPDFRVDRESLVATPISRAEAVKLADGQASKRIVQAGHTYDRPFTTSEGISYEAPHGTCDPWEEDGLPVSKIHFDSDEIEVGMNSCSSAYEIESTVDYLWVGTSRWSEHGDYGAEGLLVFDRDTLATVTRIDTGVLAIRNVVQDPFSNYIWAITDDQITIVSGNLQHQHILQFYHEFNSSTANPEVRLQQGRHNNNPLAIIASGLPEDSRPDFYEQSKNIPGKLRSRLSLYDYFMCCSFSYLRDPLPEEFNVLVPFLRIGARNTWEANRGKPRNWRQIACKLDHPDAEKLCASDTWFRGVN